MMRRWGWWLAGLHETLENLIVTDNPITNEVLPVLGHVFGYMSWIEFSGTAVTKEAWNRVMNGVPEPGASEDAAERQPMVD